MAIAGHRAPYVRVFRKDVEISMRVRRFRYVYSEEGDDICELDLQSDNQNMADEDTWEVRSELQILWGYIGEPSMTITRKVYVQDTRWTYGDVVEGFIVCTDKAHSLSFDSSPEVFNDSTLPHIVKKVADKHDLKVKVGIIKESAVISDVLAIANWEKELAENRRVEKLTQVFVDFTLWDKSYNKNKDSWKYSAQAADNQTINKNTVLPNNFNIYKSIPNGRTNLRIFMQKLAMREKGGNTVIDTRDDTITIRKRNFMQASYKSYHYRGAPNEIVEFAPEYRNRRRSNASNEMNFNGWDGANKEFYDGNTNTKGDNSSDALSKLQYQISYLKGLPSSDIVGTFQLDPLNGQMRYNKNRPKRLNYYKQNATVGGAAAFQTFADQTNTYKDINIPITVGEEIAILETMIANQGKSLYDPTSNNPYDTFNNAANARREADLNRNPATLSIEGDPHIEVGIVVTIIGSAKKHAGNYYVIESEHEIAGDSYLTQMQLVRDGNNYKVKDGVDVTKYGKKHNESKGPIEKDHKRKVKQKKQ